MSQGTQEFILKATRPETRYQSGGLTVDAAIAYSSSSNPWRAEGRIKIRIPVNKRTQHRPSEAVMIIHAPWSVSVTTANGGYCPGGTTKPELEPDMIVVRLCNGPRDCGEMRGCQKQAPSAIDILIRPGNVETKVHGSVKVGEGMKQAFSP